MHAPTIIQAGIAASIAVDVSASLDRIGYKVLAIASLRQLSRAVQVHTPALLLVDDVETIADSVPVMSASTPIVVLTADESVAKAVRALRFGATDYFHWPREREAFLEKVRQLVPLVKRSEDDTLSGALVGDNPAMLEVRRQVRRAAQTDCNVLIVGETGTGKELAAGFVHSMSRRASRPFVGMNCAAIPETLLESELFGYERGAFTGAVTARDGKLQQADGGTLFLDEVGDMSLVAQAKVLRAFESKAVYRLGSRTPVVPDVRFIAATNSDLIAARAEHRFRSDLYYRLNVAQIQMPALRERPDDIPLLIGCFVRECSARYKRLQEISRDALRRLVLYSWPGNVRELRNLVEATFVNSSARWLSWSDLPPQFRRQLAEPLEKPGGDERERLLSALAETQWNKSKAANRLHWSRMTLYRKLAKYKVGSR